jgi:lysophospholipase L1-like esterase
VQEPEPHGFIAIGDSVSSGYGLEGYFGMSSDEVVGRHTTLLFEMLRDDGYVDEYKNMAVSGFTTSMLLRQLYGLNEDELVYFRNARVITVNIGGNNVLTPFLGFLSGLDINNPITGLMILMPILTGRFPAELEAALEAGVQTFLDEFAEIINWLDEFAPYATVMVNTVYNPIPSEFMGFSAAAVSARADELMGIINGHILYECEKMGFLTVDLYSYFAGQLNLFAYDLVHPNVEGHELIAQMQYAAFTEHRSLR